MYSAAESERGELLCNAKEIEALRTTLTEMGCPQKANEIITDNSTAYGIMRGKIKKRIKAIDMRFCWVRYRVKKKHFDVKWNPGHLNLGD